MDEVSRRLLAKAHSNRGIASLDRMMAARQPSLRRHCLETACAAVDFGQAWNLPERDLSTLFTAGLVHDVGQLYWQDYQFTAPKEELTDKDLSWMRHHPRSTFNRIRPYDEEVACIAVEHHEWQQDAYPRRNPQQGFNLLSHMLVLADKFQALMEARPYRSEVFTLPEAAAIVRADYTGSPMLLEQYVGFLAERNVLEDVYH